HIPLGRPKVVTLRADLVEGNDQKQFPKLFSGRHVVVPQAGAAEKTAEDGLHDVLSIHLASQLGRTLSVRQCVHALHVAQVELCSGILAPLTYAVEQRMVRSLRTDARWHDDWIRIRMVQRRSPL